MFNKNIKDFFKLQDFPQNLVSKDISESELEFLFEMSQSSKVEKNRDLSRSYILQDNTKRHVNNANNFERKRIYDDSKGSYQNKSNYNRSYNSNNSGRTEGIKDYVDNMEMTGGGLTINRTNNQSKYLHDTMAEVKADFKQEETIGSNKTNQGLRPAEAIETIFTQEVKEEINLIPVFRMQEPAGVNKKVSVIPVNIKMIFRINEKLKYPVQEPLWYTYHHVARSSFGPLSSVHLEELYNKKHIDGDSDIRLIDIFGMKNKKPFAFFKLKEVENENFVRDQIEESSLSKYVDELNHFKKEESKKAEIRNKNSKAVEIDQQDYVKETMDKYKNKEKIVYFEEMFDDNRGGEAIDLTKYEDDCFRSEKTIKTITTCNNNIGKGREQAENFEPKNYDKLVKRANNPVASKNNPTIFLPIKNDVASVIDEVFSKEVQTEQKTKQTKGKKKGKPVDLDIKTGFYTLSHQEKNYEPIYICGDLSK